MNARQAGLAVAKAACAAVAVAGICAGVAYQWPELLSSGGAAKDKASKHAKSQEANNAQQNVVVTDARAKASRKRQARQGPPPTIDELREMVDARPQDAAPHYQLARALAKAGSLEDALDHARKAARLKPSMISAHILLGNVATRLSEQIEDTTLLEEAEAAFRVAAGPACAKASADLRASANYNLGNTLYRKRQYEKAIPFYRAALELNDSHAAARTNLGLCCLYTKDHEAAIGAFIVAARQDSENPQSWYNLGTAYEQAGNFDGAVEAYASAAGLSPKNVMLQLRLGETCRKAGRITQAVDAYKRALELEPGLDSAQKALDSLQMQVAGH